jgi:hypothetical protein
LPRRRCQPILDHDHKIGLLGRAELLARLDLAGFGPRVEGVCTAMAF